MTALQEQSGTAGVDETPAADSTTPATTADDTKSAPAANGETPVAGAKPAAQAQPKGKTLATGADTEEDDQATEPAAKASLADLTDDLRKEIAEHYAAGDKKAYAKELRRLEGIRDVKSIWGMYRELEGRFTGGGLVKVPGKDAKPDEVAAFNKALGVPEKPEEYFKDIKLDNGAVIGDADKPVADSFAAAVHKAGAPPAVVNAAMNWYFANQEAKAAEIDEADEDFRRTSERDLKDEFGAGFRRKTNAIGTLFATAPGGVDIKNEQSLYARLMGGRTADGRLIGDDPDMVRFLVNLAQEVHPEATVVTEGNQSGLSVEAEIEKIEGVMRTNRQEYNKKYADRYLDLLKVREKMQARGRA